MQSWFLVNERINDELKITDYYTNTPTPSLSEEELKVLTYGSFNSDGGGPNIEKFESICNCDFVWNTQTHQGSLSRVKLTKNNEGFDVLLGLDDSLIKEEENELFLD